MTVDMSKEAVERLAEDVMKPDYLSPTRHTVAATLRALAAENADLRAECALLQAERDVACNRHLAAEAERDALKARDEQWKQKAAAWLASPEGVERLEGYRAMGSRLAAMEADRDAARAEVARLREAMWFYSCPEQAPGGVRDEWISRMDKDRGRAARAALAQKEGGDADQ